MSIEPQSDTGVDITTEYTIFNKQNAMARAVEFDVIVRLDINTAFSNLTFKAYSGTSGTYLMGGAAVVKEKDAGETKVEYRFGPFWVQNNEYGKITVESDNSSDNSIDYECTPTVLQVDAVLDPKGVYVDGNGSDNNVGQHPNLAKADVETAITNANTSENIILCPGGHTSSELIWIPDFVSITGYGKERSFLNVDWEQDAGEIAANGPTPYVAVTPGNYTAIRDLTVYALSTNGSEIQAFGWIRYSTYDGDDGDTPEYTTQNPEYCLVDNCLLKSDDVPIVTAYGVSDLNDYMEVRNSTLAGRLEGLRTCTCNHVISLHDTDVIIAGDSSVDTYGSYWAFGVCASSFGENYAADTPIEVPKVYMQGGIVDVLTSQAGGGANPATMVYGLEAAYGKVFAQDVIVRTNSAEGEDAGEDVQDIQIRNAGTQVTTNQLYDVGIYGRNVLYDNTKVEIDAITGANEEVLDINTVILENNDHGGDVATLGLESVSISSSSAVAAVNILNSGGHGVKIKTTGTDTYENYNNSAIRLETTGEFAHGLHIVTTNDYGFGYFIDTVGDYASSAVYKTTGSTAHGLYFWTDNTDSMVINVLQDVSASALHSDIVTQIQSGLSTFDASSDEVDVGKLDGDATSLARFKKSVDAILTGTVAVDASNSATSFATDLPQEAANYYGNDDGGMVIAFVYGTTNQYQTRRIISSTNAANPVITLESALDAEPGEGDTFVVLGRITELS